MRKIRAIRISALLLALIFVFSACSAGGSKNASTELDLTTLTIDQITTKAKEEGTIESVGMPPDWANWEDSWNSIGSKYGLAHNDLDLSSSEQLATFENEKSAPTKDLGDVGQAFGPIAMEMGVVQPYKATTWSSIPDWAKDPDGNWVISYVGTICFIANGKLTSDRPTSWQDIRNGSSKFSVGDATRAAISHAAFLSANMAFGGDMENLDPGIEFFKEMAEAGRLDPGELGQNRYIAGEIEVAIHWDFNTLKWRDMLLESDSSADPYLYIPSDGAVRSGYALVINKYAPHPHAAALTVDYLLSDEGQIERAKGYAKPIRDVKLPPELEAIMLPNEQYANAFPITDNPKYKAYTENLAKRWEEEIIPLMAK